MRPTVRQRWCSLLSETVWPQRHRSYGRCRTRLQRFPSTSLYEADTRCQQFSTDTVFQDRSVALTPPPPQSQINATLLSSSADVLYHQAVVLAASAAHLGHPHAVVSVIDSLRQQRQTASLNHPALYNHLLRAYLNCDNLSANSRYSKMRDVWRGMLAEKVRCNRQTYALLLNGCINKHRQLLHEAQTQQAQAADSKAASVSAVPPSSSPPPSCLQECLSLVKDVSLSTFICNLLIKAALLSNNHSYPFHLFQHSFPPLAPNSATLSLLVDAALTAPAATARDNVNKAVEWYNRVRDTSKQSAASSAASVAGTPAMYAKLMRRCLQYSDGTQEVQHVPVLFSHMEEGGLRVEAEHIRCLVLALSRLQLRGVGWRVWHEMESARHVQRTDETDALMLRVMSEEKDYKRAMEVINSIQQRWVAQLPTAASDPSSSVVSNYRSALSNIARNGNSATLLALLSHVFSSSRYASAVLRDGMLESVVRRWKEAGRSVGELRAKVRQWVSAASMDEQEMEAWQTLAALLTSQRAQPSEDESDALNLRTLSKTRDHNAAIELILRTEQRWAAKQLRHDSSSSSSSSPSPLSSSVVAYYRSALYNVAGRGSTTLLLTFLSHVFSSRYSAVVLKGGKLDALVRRWRESGKSVDELSAQVRQWQSAVDMDEQEKAGWLALTAALATHISDSKAAATTSTHPQHGTHGRQQHQVNGSSTANHQHSRSTVAAATQYGDGRDAAGKQARTAVATLAPASSMTAVNGGKRAETAHAVARVSPPRFELRVVNHPAESDDRSRGALSAVGGVQ